MRLERNVQVAGKVWAWGHRRGCEGRDDSNIELNAIMISLTATKRPCSPPSRTQRLCSVVRCARCSSLTRLTTDFNVHNLLPEIYNCDRTLFSPQITHQGARSCLRNRAIGFRATSQRMAETHGSHLCDAYAAFDISDVETHARLIDVLDDLSKCLASDVVLRSVLQCIYPSS